MNAQLIGTAKHNLGNIYYVWKLQEGKETCFQVTKENKAPNTFAGYNNLEGLLKYKGIKMQG